MNKVETELKRNKERDLNLRRKLALDNWIHVWVLSVCLLDGKVLSLLIVRSEPSSLLVKDNQRENDIFGEVSPNC